MGDMNSYTIRQNCADNNIILNDCKLTCGNCATSSPSSIPSVLPSTSAVPSLIPSSQPTACFDLNLEKFLVTKYTKAGIVKEIKNNKDCVNFKNMNSYTIRQNCADNNIILNDCKLTCGNCATSSQSSIPSVLPSTVPSGLPSVLPSTVPRGLPSVVS